MSQLNKFYAASAIYFGLASAVVAQPRTVQPDAPAAAETENMRQDRFQHPMVDPRPSTDLRPDADAERRIQRRGLDDVRQDGEIRRNVLPGATRSDETLLPPERRAPDRRMPDR